MEKAGAERQRPEQECRQYGDLEIDRPAPLKKRNDQRPMVQGARWIEMERKRRRLGQTGALPALRFGQLVTAKTKL